MKIVIEGITTEGKLCRGLQNYTVKDWFENTYWIDLFVTGMVKRGFEIKLIMEFAGIKDHRTLSRYLQQDNDYKREQLKNWGSL